MSNLTVVCQVTEWYRGFLPRKLVLEIICVVIELTDHVIDFSDVMLKSVFLALDLLVPDHSEESLDVGLGLVSVSKHL